MVLAFGIEHMGEGGRGAWIEEKSKVLEVQMSIDPTWHWGAGHR